MPKGTKVQFPPFPNQHSQLLPSSLLCAIDPLWQFGEAHGLRMLLNASNETQSVIKDTDYVDIHLSRHFLKL